MKQLLLILSTLASMSLCGMEPDQVTSLFISNLSNSNRPLTLELQKRQSRACKKVPVYKIRWNRQAGRKTACVQNHQLAQNDIKKYYILFTTQDGRKYRTTHATLRDATDGSIIFSGPVRLASKIDPSMHIYANTVSAP